jgi:ribosomal protein L16/L10AE
MKFKKYHKSLYKKNTYLKNYNFSNFDYIVIVKESSIYTNDQFLSIQKDILKIVKLNKSFLFNFIKPYFFLTSKPSESRMGGGKGNLDMKVCFVKKGQVLLGLRNIPLFSILDLFSQICYKLPFKISLIKLKY